MQKKDMQPLVKVQVRDGIKCFILKLIKNKGDAENEKDRTNIRL
jgi:hypothetical protein